MRVKAGSWLLSKELKRFKQETGARAFNEGWRKRKKEAVEGFDVALTRCWVSTHLFCHVVSLTHSKCLYSKLILHELQISGSREAHTLYIGGYVPVGAREKGMLPLRQSNSSTSTEADFCYFTPTSFQVNGTRTFDRRDPSPTRLSSCT